MNQPSIITACQKTVGAMKSYVFRSYHPEFYTIWEVLRASTAAPTYFAPLRLSLREGIEAKYYDGGYWGLMNPSIKGYDSIRETSGNVPVMVISLGSGASPHPRRTLGRGSALILQWPASLKRNAESIHLEMMDRATGREGRPYYSRLNVLERLDDMELDEWKGKHGIDTLRFIREQTEKYLRLDHVKKGIAEAARRLVDARRARASTDHWERFCHGVEYVCTVIGYKDNVNGDRGDLRRHLEDVHQMDSSRTETVLDQGKRFPLYAGKGCLRGFRM